MRWQPTEAQKAFLDAFVREAAIGGGGGCGGTEALIIDPIRFREDARFRALILASRHDGRNRTLHELARRFYTPFGAKAYGYTWRFPAGATVELGVLGDDNDLGHYDGTWTLICFDDLATFTEGQYLAMLPRVQNLPDGPAARIRSTIQPDATGREWVLKRFHPWISGQVKNGSPRAIGDIERVLIWATIADNPHADPLTGPMFRAAHGDVRYKRRILGDWTIEDPPPAAVSLEEVFTGREWFGLTQATPLQRAVCRWATGQDIGDLREQDPFPDIEEYPPEIVERATWDWFVGPSDPTEVPLEVLLLAAIRSGKSLLAAAVSVYASQTVDLSGVREGEIPLFPILSISKKLADAVFEHLMGAIRSSPKVAALVSREPTNESVFLRHPDGHEMEIRVVAASPQGSNIVGRWLFGMVMDEAARMTGQAEGSAVNLDNERRAGLERLLPGGQIWYISAPWAPFGPAYRMVTQHWQRPSSKLVVRGIGPAMNFIQKWTPEAAWRVRSDDYQVYLTDCLGEFADQETGWLRDEELQAVTRDEPKQLARQEGVIYVAVMDPAVQTNAWTLAIAGQYADGRRRIALAKQWVPSYTEALDSRKVMPEIGSLCRSYGVHAVFTDQWAPTLLQERAQDNGFALIVEHNTAPMKVDQMQNFCDFVRRHEVDLPNEPYLLEDLKQARRRVTQNGLSVHLPTSADGRHCDYQPSVTRAVIKAIYPATEKIAQGPGTTTHRDRQDQRDLEEMLAGGPRRHRGRAPQRWRIDVDGPWRSR